MLDRGELERAIDIHRTCYALLKWLGSALDRSFVSPSAAHAYLSDVDAAAAWVAEHFANIPPDCRPASPDGVSLRTFANYLASYLVASFDLEKAPGPRLISNHGGCYCRICSYVGRAPYLKPKRVTAEGRRRAGRLKAACLLELAAGEGIGLQSAVLAHVQGRHGQDLALATYGRELVRRCHGHASGPEALALWRQIAWRHGGPRRDFELTAGSILEAEDRLRAVLRVGQRRGAAEQGDEADER